MSHLKRCNCHRRPFTWRKSATGALDCLPPSTAASAAQHAWKYRYMIFHSHIVIQAAQTGLVPQMLQIHIDMRRLLASLQHLRCQQQEFRSAVQSLQNVHLNKLVRCSLAGLAGAAAGLAAVVAGPSAAPQPRFPSCVPGAPPSGQESIVCCYDVVVVSLDSGSRGTPMWIPVTSGALLDENGQVYDEFNTWPKF